MSEIFDFVGAGMYIYHESAASDDLRGYCPDSARARSGDAGCSDERICGGSVCDSLNDSQVQQTYQGDR